MRYTLWLINSWQPFMNTKPLHGAKLDLGLWTVECDRLMTSSWWSIPPVFITAAVLISVFEHWDGRLVYNDFTRTYLKVCTQTKLRLVWVRYFFWIALRYLLFKTHWNLKLIKLLSSGVLGSECNKNIYSTIFTWLSQRYSKSKQLILYLFHKTLLMIVHVCIFQHGKPSLHDLCEDLRDGEALLSLLEILTGQQFVSIAINSHGCVLIF